MSDQFIGTDVTSLLHSKKQSNLFVKHAGSQNVGFYLFIAQLLGWIVEKVLIVIVFFLDILLYIEKAIINLREDTLQLFYWGRGNVFALFSQSLILFVSIIVAFTSLVGNGYLWGMSDGDIDVPTKTFATSRTDVAIQSGSLLVTASSSQLQRVDMEEYVVTYGDTVGGKTLDNIALKWDVSADSIRWANNYDESFQPKPGTKIKIPPVSGIYYTVVDGENLEILAARFKVDQATIAEVNFLSEPYILTAGQQILLPGVSQQATAGKSKVNTAWGSVPKFLSWPVLQGNGGDVSRCWYGSYSHNGIDITPMGTGTWNPTIYAAAPGRVTYAQIHCTPGMSFRTVCGGYAWAVEIDHGNGYSTIYGHLEANSIMVKVGDQVDRYQPIARMGNTGTVFGDPGTHLHFQLNHGGFLGKSSLKAVDPAPYLMDPHSCAL